jgi:predicted Zn-dependent protease with MMP-like domain
MEEALRDLPDEFAHFLEEVPIEVRDDPSPHQLQIAHIPPNGLLLGLYQGRPRTRRSVEDSGAMPDVIFIFQNPIEQVCNTLQDVTRQVRITLLHEIGHHFGLDEDDLEKLGYR